VSYALTTAAGVAPKTFGGNLWREVVNTANPSVVRDANVAEGGVTAADPVVLKAGITLVVNGGTAITGYGAGTVTYSCLSSDPSIATVSGTQTCTVTPQAQGTVTIWNVATANNSAGVANSKTIPTFVEVRTTDAYSATSGADAGGAADLTWSVVDTYNSSSFLVRQQRGTLTGIGSAFNALVTSSSMVQNNCYVSLPGTKSGAPATATSSVDPITKVATCVVVRAAAPVGPNVTATNANYTQAAVAAFTLRQYTRVVVPGAQLYSLPVVNSKTAVVVPATVATLFTAVNTPSLSGVVGVAVPVSVKVVDQYGVARNGVTLTLNAGTNVTCSPDDVAGQAACNTITATTAGGSSSTEGIATFYVKPTAAGAAALDITVSGAYYNSTGLLTAITIPQGQTATYALTGTAVAAPVNPTATFTGSITHTGVFPRNMTNAAAPYAFTIGGLTATNGATVTYNCVASTTAGSNTPSTTFVTATYSAASGTPTCTITPVLDATSAGTAGANLVPVYVRLSATIGGSGFVSATPPTVVEVVVNRIP